MRGKVWVSVIDFVPFWPKRAGIQKIQNGMPKKKIPVSIPDCSDQFCSKLGRSGQNGRNHPVPAGTSSIDSSLFLGLRWNNWHVKKKKKNPKTKKKGKKRKRKRRRYLGLERRKQQPVSTFEQRRKLEAAAASTSKQHMSSSLFLSLPLPLKQPTLTSLKQWTIAATSHLPRATKRSSNSSYWFSLPASPLPFPLLFFFSFSFFKLVAPESIRSYDHIYNAFFFSFTPSSFSIMWVPVQWLLRFFFPATVNNLFKVFCFFSYAKNFFFFKWIDYNKILKR